MLHIRKIKPLHNYLIVTGERYNNDVVNNGLIETNKYKGDLKLYQKVIAIGSTVRGIEVGDTVMINPVNYAVKRYDKNSIQNDLGNNPVIEFRFNWVTIDDEKGVPQECMLITDSDVLYVFEGEEVSDSIIIPDKPKIIAS